MSSKSKTYNKQPLSAINFGDDWHHLREHVLTDAPKGSREPFIAETRMLILPHAVPGSHGIAAILLNKIVALIASGDRGVPMDRLLLFWLHHANVDEVYPVIDGKPHLAIHSGSRIALMFGNPSRWEETA